MSLYDGNYATASPWEIRNFTGDAEALSAAYEFYWEAQDLRALDTFQRIWERAVAESAVEGTVPTEIVQLNCSAAELCQHFLLEERLYDNNYYEDFIEIYYQLFLSTAMLYNRTEQIDISNRIISYASDLNEVYSNTLNQHVKQAIGGIACALQLAMAAADDAPKGSLIVSFIYSIAKLTLLKRQFAPMRKAYDALIENNNLEGLCSEIYESTKCLLFLTEQSQETSNEIFDPKERSKVAKYAFVNYTATLHFVRIYRFLYGKKRAKLFAENPKEFAQSETIFTRFFERCVERLFSFYDSISKPDSKIRLLYMASMYYRYGIVHGLLSNIYEKKMLAHIYHNLDHIAHTITQSTEFESLFECFELILCIIYRRHYRESVEFGKLGFLSYIHWVFRFYAETGGFISEIFKSKYRKFYGHILGYILNFPLTNADERETWEIYPVLSMSKMTEYTLSQLELGKHLLSFSGLQEAFETFESVTQEEICEHIPDQAFLLDFYFNRKKSFSDSDDSFDEEYRDLSKYDFSCFAIDNSGDISVSTIMTADELRACVDLYLDRKMPKFQKDENGDVVYDGNGNAVLRPRYKPGESDYMGAATIHTYEEAERMLYEMTENLLSPFERKGKTRIIVSAESVLNSIPFAVLPYRDKEGNNGYVIDCFAVRNIANIYDLINPRTRDQVDSSLVVYPVEFGDGGNDLLHSERECEDLLDLIKKTMFTGAADDEGEKLIARFKLAHEDATKNNVIFRLRNNKHDVLHIATHGIIDENGSPCFVLAGEDGDMTLLSDAEIVESAQKTNLATLSLCWGGRMSEAAQDSLSGFIRAMLQNGTASVIAPLEEVDDRATKKLFHYFYRMYLDVNNSETIESVWRKAVQALRSTRGLVEYSEPQFWAPWVLYSAISE